MPISGRWRTNHRAKTVHYIVNGVSLCGWFKDGKDDAERFKPWNPEHPKTCPVCKRLYYLQIKVGINTLQQV